MAQTEFESFQVCQNKSDQFFQIVGRLGIHLNYTPVVRKLVQTPQLRIKKLSLVSWLVNLATVKHYLAILCTSNHRWGWSLVSLGGHHLVGDSWGNHQKVNHKASKRRRHQHQIPPPPFTLRIGHHLLLRKTATSCHGNTSLPLLIPSSTTWKWKRPFVLTNRLENQVDHILLCGAFFFIQNWGFLLILNSRRLDDFQGKKFLEPTLAPSR